MKIKCRLCGSECMVLIDVCIPCRKTIRESMPEQAPEEPTASDTIKIVAQRG